MPVTEDEKHIIRQRLGTYLESRGINILRNFACLLGHSEKQSHMSYSENNQTVKCFACNAGGDIFDIMGFINGIKNTADTFIERYNLACDAVGLSSYKKPVNNQIAIKTDKPVITEIPLTDHSISFQKWHTNLLKSSNREKTDKGENKAFTYLTSTRKISLNILIKYRIGYNPKACGNYGGIIIPTSKYSFITGQLVHNTRYPKYTASKGTRNHLGFNNIFTDELDINPCFVVEGEMDMLTVESCNYACIALGGTQFVQSFVKKLFDITGKVKTIRPLILALDNDEAGKKATEQLTNLLNAHSIPYLVATDIYGDYKDANEAYCHTNTEDSEDKKLQDKFISRLGKFYQLAQNLPNAQNMAYETFKQNYNALHCPAIDIIKNKINGQIVENVYKTGFNNLDIMLGGGLRTGLYCLGGMPSTGKTTFALQIADSLALNGQPVLFFTVEMSTESLIAKSISRLTQGNEKSGYTEAASTYALYDQARTSEQTANILYAFELYKNIGINLHFIECFDTSWSAEKISTETNNYIMLSGKRPIVIIDYLQIIPPTQTNKSIKDNVDNTAKIFKQLASKSDIPVIVLSNMNRDSYGDKNIQQEINEARKKHVRNVELSLIKQRSHTAVNKTIYTFTGAHNHFAEAKNTHKNKVKSYMSSFKESGGIEYSADVLLTLLDFVAVDTLPFIKKGDS